MIEWRRVPWPLWIYSASLLLGGVLFEVKAHGPIVAKALLAAVMLGWLYFLLKGMRWVWIMTVGIYVLAIVVDLTSGSLEWHGLALSIASPILLLLPVTRQYFSKHTSAAV
jgi:hypothetical protein